MTTGSLLVDIILILFAGPVLGSLAFALAVDWYKNRRNRRSIELTSMLWCDSGVILQRRMTGALVAWQAGPESAPREERPCALELLRLIRGRERREPTRAESEFFSRQLEPWRWRRLQADALVA